MSDTYNYEWTPPDEWDFESGAHIPSKEELEAAKKKIRDANDSALKNSNPRPRYETG